MLRDRERDSRMMILQTHPVDLKRATYEATSRFGEMRILLLIPIAISGFTSFGSAQGKDSGHWDLDQLNGAVITAHGPAKQGEGVSGKSMVLDGRTVVELNDSAALNAETSGFTVSIWFNPYELASRMDEFAPTCIRVAGKRLPATRH